MSYKFTRFGDFMEEERILKEMAIAGYGDWKPSKEMIGSITKFILDKNWEYKGTETLKGTVYRIYKQKNVYIAGYFMENSEGKLELEVDFEIKLSQHNSIARVFKINKPLMNVDGVRVQETAQGYGIATMMYKYLVKKEDVIILGDEVQYFGARRLWSKLSQQVDVRVDIIDLESEKVLEKDVILKHGTEDWEFDNRVWSYNYDKKHIRLILKEIK